MKVLFLLTAALYSSLAFSLTPELEDFHDEVADAGFEGPIYIESESGAALRSWFRVVCLKNNTNRTIYYQAQYGRYGSWRSFQVSPGYTQPFYISDTSINIVNVKWNYKVSGYASYKDASLSAPYAEYEDCAYGKTYFWKIDNGRYINISH